MPLNALRSFEAMARTGRATLAGDELYVTHSAVSRQVKALEATLGVRLFAGPKHRLALTETGRRLLPVLTEAFDNIAAATLRAPAGDRQLYLAVNASVSVKWLIPRLERFAKVAPDIEIHLIELDPNAYTHRDAHATLRLAREDISTSLPEHRLVPNYLGPVLAPRLARKIRRLDPAALSDLPRLVADTRPDAWSEWASLEGIDIPARPERRFAHLHFAQDAALSGLGCAVLPWPLVADDIVAGRLVAPFGLRAASGGLTLIALPPFRSPALTRFKTWLEREAQRMPSVRPYLSAERPASARPKGKRARWLRG